MKLSDVKKVVSAKVLCGEERLDTEVQTACGCDLMSDVLSFVKDQALLLTGLINEQVVRTAEMMDMKAIIFVRGKTPSEAILSLANEAGIVILSTDLPMYLACGMLYANGLYK